MSLGEGMEGDVETVIDYFVVRNPGLTFLSVMLGGRLLLSFLYFPCLVYMAWAACNLFRG